MNALIWIIGIAAILALIVGGTVKAAGFLIGVAPILLIVVIALFILKRSRGRRMPQ